MVVSSLYHARTHGNPVAAGALTGGLFKAGAGVRGAALASAIGAGFGRGVALPAGAAL